MGYNIEKPENEITRLDSEYQVTWGYQASLYNPISPSHPHTKRNLDCKAAKVM